MNLPHGTVTFLFTDIAGSTRLWQDCPALMPDALARHDALLRTAIETNNGFVVKTIGDAFMAVFATAPQGVNAAVMAQRSLCAEPWPAETPVRVRMGLHTGASDERDNDYYGHEVNRAARIQGVAHAGQIVVSQSVHALLEGRLPEPVTLLDLGSQQLKDLREPESLWQLCHPDLPTAFPPLNSLSHWPNNLPRQLSSFVGRQGEIEEIKRLLARGACLTLSGAGGTGKTRLAVQVAAEALPDFAQGVWLVELASLTDPSLIPQAAVAALGLREEPAKTSLQTLMEHCRARTLLLILDNCEHLLDACARLTDTLLRSSPRLKILATSREAFHITGEQIYHVPSLSLPRPDQKMTVESLAEYEAPYLFLERARTVAPHFAVTAENVPFLVQICRRLDGIPLAIELAAARVRSLSVEDIHTRLDNRFYLLTGGSRTALHRQQTLRGAIDWSYDLLTEREQALLQRLSVFTGGCTLEAVETICAGEEIEGWEILDLLSSLVDKSLVVAQEKAGGMRYRMLEMVRQYGAEKLTSGPEVATLRRRHRDWFLALAEETDLKLGRADQAQWLDVLETEHDNLRQALAYCLEEAGEGETGLRLAVVMQEFWLTRGYFFEARERTAALLARPEAQERTKTRASALNAAGRLAWRQGDYAASRPCYEESLAIRRELGDQAGIARSLGNLGLLTYSQGDYFAARSLYEESLVLKRAFGDRSSIAHSLNGLGLVADALSDYATARSYYEECLTIWRELGDRASITGSLSNLGVVAYHQADYAAAHALFEEGLAIWRELGDRPNIADALANLGTVARQRAEKTLARSHFEESLAIRRELGDRRGVASSLSSLGGLAQDEGDTTRARSLFEQSLALRRELDDKVGLVASVEAFAGLALKEGHTARAVPLWGAAERLREEIGTPRSLQERDACERHLAEARQRLSEAAFSTAWLAGRAMSMEQAIDAALDHQE